LSFLAFVGILVLAPALTVRIPRALRSWQSLLVETMCAIVLTTPLILFVFGRLSVIAPLSNLVVLPFIPLAMALTAIAGLGGMFLPAIAGILAAPTQWLLSFLIGTMKQLAAVPGAQRLVSINRDQM